MSFYSGSLGQEYSDPNDYFNVANHEVDQQEELEYEVGNQKIKNDFSFFFIFLKPWVV